MFIIVVTALFDDTGILMISGIPMVMPSLGDVQNTMDREVTKADREKGFDYSVKEIQDIFINGLSWGVRGKGELIGVLGSTILTLTRVICSTV